MKTLRQLVEALDTVTVRLAGQEFKARRLTALEGDVLIRAFPPPTPPEKPDPNFGGSLAPKIIDINDPQYIADCDGYQFERYLDIVAVAIGHEGLGIAEQWPTVTLANHSSVALLEQVRAFILAARPLVIAATEHEIKTAATAVLRRASTLDAQKN